MRSRVFVNIFCLLGVLFFGSAAHAESETVEVTLHKLLFDQSFLPAEKANDGTNDPHEDLLQNYVGLDDVEFAVYDVTEEFYRLRETSPFEAAEQELLQKDPEKLPRTFIEKQRTSTVEGEKGIAKFTVPAKAQDRDAVYLFIEESAPEMVKTKAAPMLVVLPVTDTAGAENSVIHLYPKNESRELQPEIKKKVLGSTEITLGATVSYEIEGTIPENSWNYQYYEIIDEASESLRLTADSVKVTSDQPIEAQITTTAHSFTIRLNQEQLKHLAGKKIQVAYQMTLQDTADQTVFKNQAKVVYQRQERPAAESPIAAAEVYSGGKGFKKVDRVTNKGLADAKFVIQNTKGMYLKRTTDSGWTADKQQAYQLTSGKDGTFAITGLKSGEYRLLETSAPSGYVLNRQAIPFTVDRKSYQAPALNVVNEPESATAKTKPAAVKAAAAKSSRLEKQYPKTGAIANLNYMIWGIILIAVAFGIKTIKGENYEKE